MELKSTNALQHIHLTPILVLSLAIFLFSVFGIGNYIASKPGNTNTGFYNIFNARLFTVHVTASGLPTISRYGSNTPVTGTPLNTNNVSAGEYLNQISTTGEVTILNAEIDNSQLGN